MADDSKPTDVGSRYALALFELAKDQGKLSVVEADLKSLKAMRADSADLRRLLGSPGFSAEDKGKGLAAVAAKAGFDSTTRKFLGLIAANRRTEALPGAITAFEALAAAERGTVAAEVTTATTLTPPPSRRAWPPPCAWRWARTPRSTPASTPPSSAG